MRNASWVPSPAPATARRHIAVTAASAVFAYLLLVATCATTIERWAASVPPEIAEGLASAARAAGLTP
jgi:hypothetical protein